MVKYYYYKKGVHNEIKDFYAHMCKIASQLLHEYKKPNLVVYGKILYMVKIKADFSYIIKSNKKEIPLVKVNNQSQGEGTFLEPSGDDQKLRCVP